MRSGETMPSVSPHSSNVIGHGCFKLSAETKRGGETGSTSRTECNITSSRRPTLSQKICTDDRRSLSLGTVDTCATIGSRSVSFGDVEITSFPVVLSDNPGGIMGGPPIGLGRKPFSRAPDTFDLETYEAHRAGQRRKPGAMMLPPSIRYVRALCR
jgi:hypothetical protein